MLTIRFARVGRRNKAQFKIMLQEHTIAPGGRHIEVLGSYNPHSKEAVLKEDRIAYWISKGAQMSDTACNLFIKKGIVKGDKRKVKVPARNASPSEKVDENSGQVEVLKESTNAEKHSEAGGPAKKVEEVAAETEAGKEAEVAPAEEVKKEEIAPAKEVKTEEVPAAAEAVTDKPKA